MADQRPEGVCSTARSGRSRSLACRCRPGRHLGQQLRWQQAATQQGPEEPLQVAKVGDQVARAPGQRGVVDREVHQRASSSTSGRLQPRGFGPGMVGRLTGKKVSRSPSGRRMRRVTALGLPVAASMIMPAKHIAGVGIRPGGRASRAAGRRSGRPAPRRPGPRPSTGIVYRVTSGSSALSGCRRCG